MKSLSFFVQDKVNEKTKKYLSVKKSGRKTNNVMTNNVIVTS